MSFNKSDSQENTMANVNDNKQKSGLQSSDEVFMPPPPPEAPSQQAAKLQQSSTARATPTQTAISTQDTIQIAARNLWYVQADLWKGRMGDVFRRIENVVIITGSRRIVWLLPFLASALTFGLLLAGWTSQVMELVTDGVSTATFGLVDLDVPFSTYVKTFVIGTLFYFVVMLVRSLVVLLTHRICGGNAGFQDSATQVGVGITLYWFPLLIGFIFAIISNIFLNVLFMFFMIGVSIMCELTIYIGISRHGPHKRSPMVAYTWLSVISGIVHFILLIIFVTIYVFSL